MDCTVGETRAENLRYYGDGINSNYTNPNTGLPGTIGVGPHDYQGEDDGDGAYAKGTENVWIARNYWCRSS